MCILVATLILFGSFVERAVAQVTYPVDLTVPYNTPSPLGDSGITYILTLDQAYDTGATPLLGFRSGAGVLQRWPNGNFGLSTTNYGFTVIFSAPGTIIVTNTVDEDPNYRGGAMQNDQWRLTGDQGTWSLVDNGVPVGIDDAQTSVNGVTLELGWDGAASNSALWGSVSLVGGSGLTIRSINNNAGNGGRLLFMTNPTSAADQDNLRSIPMLGAPALAILIALISWLARIVLPRRRRTGQQ